MTQDLTSSGSSGSPKRAREWTPERFEFAFGLPDMDGRDEHSTPEPALIDGRFRLRGSIDLIERHRKTGFLRVTDHKTGKNRTKSRPDRRRRRPRAAAGDLRPGAEGALSRRDGLTRAGCSSARRPAAFSQHEIPLMGDAPKRGLEVLEIVDRAIEHGLLAARPAADACEWCDFQVVCGRDEERRTRRKDAEALRRSRRVEEDAVSPSTPLRASASKRTAS